MRIIEPCFFVEMTIPKLIYYNRFWGRSEKDIRKDFNARYYKKFNTVKRLKRI